MLCVWSRSIQKKRKEKQNLWGPASKTTVKVHSLVWTLTKRLQVVIDGLKRVVLLHCALLQKLSCRSWEVIIVLTINFSKSVPLQLPKCSGSGFVLPLLILGLLMTSISTKLTLLSALVAQFNRQQLSWQITITIKRLAVWANLLNCAKLCINVSPSASNSLAADI